MNTVDEFVDAGCDWTLAEEMMRFPILKFLRATHKEMEALPIFQVSISTSLEPILLLLTNSSSSSSSNSISVSNPQVSESDAHRDGGTANLPGQFFYY